MKAIIVNAIRKILVPVDFSEMSNQAFQVALQLAKSSKAQIKLLHIIQMPLNSGYGAFPAGIEMSMVGGIQNYDFMLPELLNQAKQQMQNLVQTGEQLGVNIEFEVLTDLGVSALMQIVSDEFIDLVIIGAEVTSGLEELLIGSDADEVVRHCPCPVLTIKQLYENFSIKNILFPSDFAPDAVWLVPYLKFFQDFFKAHLTLLCIRTGDDKLTDTQKHDRLQEFANQNGLSDYSIIIQANSSASDGILQTATQMPHDLILMATHARTGLAHLFHRSIAESVVNHATLPVLTFHWPPMES